MNNVSLFLVMCFLGAECTVFSLIISDARPSATRIYSVYEGSTSASGTAAKLIVFPDNVKILINAGPDAKTLVNLQKIMPGGDGYIDLAIITEPAIKYFGGLQAVLGQIRIGAIVYDGRDALDGDSDAAAWQALMTDVALDRIPMVTLGAGDSIHHKNQTIAIRAPTALAARSADLDEAALKPAF